MQLNRKKIKIELARQQMNEADLAKEMKISRQAVNYYFNSRYRHHKINLNTVERIAKVLNLDPKDLLI